MRHWWREARLERPAGRTVVRDRWQMDPGPAPGPTRIHLMAAGRVLIGRGHAVISALGGAGTVRVSWNPASAPCTSTVRDLDDPMLHDVWDGRLTRLEIDLTALGPTGSFELTVEEVR